MHIETREMSIQLQNQTDFCKFTPKKIGTFDFGTEPAVTAADIDFIRLKNNTCDEK